MRKLCKPLIINNKWPEIIIKIIIIKPRCDLTTTSATLSRPNQNTNKQTRSHIVRVIRDGSDPFYLRKVCDLGNRVVSCCICGASHKPAVEIIIGVFLMLR